MTSSTVAHSRQSSSPSCRSSRLTLRLGPAITPATGQHPLALRLANHSGTACALEGYPVIELLDRRGAIPFTVRRGGNQMLTSNRPSRVLVRAGGTAYVALSKYRCDLGDVRLARTLRLRPPGRATSRWSSIRIPRDADIAYCGKGDPGSIVGVSPFEPTLRAALRG